MPKRLWITYAWLDNDDGDFDHLLNQLTTAGIDAIYDKIALIPGQRLWEQIASRIAEGDLGGWAYLLTPNSLSSQPCREELAYALDRALGTQGQDFPLIGLLHQVPIAEVPVALRIRLCVDLSGPDWIEMIRAGLEHRTPASTIPETTGLQGRIHNTYLGNPSLRAVEFFPRFGEMHYWRIAYPSDGPTPVNWGIGPAGGGGVGGVLQSFIEGTVDLAGVPMKFFGAGNPLNPSTAAYIVFEHEFPTRLAFGSAAEPFGIPTQWQPIELR